MSLPRRRSSPTAEEKTELLDVLGRARPRSLTYASAYGYNDSLFQATRAMSVGIDALAELLTGDERYFWLKPHSTPARPSFATAALSPADVAWPIRAILRHQRNVKVLMARVTGIDAARRRVLTDAIEIPCDFLIVSTGATHSYFGHDEWAPVAPGLKRIEDATVIRRRILLAFERAELADDDLEAQRLLTFVIVGAGPTGVEMAGAIAEVAGEVLPADFRNVDPRSARILLLEAGPRILPSFPVRLSEYAAQALRGMGVEVRTSTRVTECTADRVETPDGPISTRTIIWAAGVVASPAASWLEADHDRAGRIVVEPDLSVPGHPEIFAIGDTAFVVGPDGSPVPGLAPAAKQMGAYVGRLIGRRVSGDGRNEPFHYRHQGDLATVGRRAAIVSVGGLNLTGMLGWLFWSAAHIYFLIGTGNRLIVAFTWLWSYLTFQRGARLITKPG